MSAQHVSTDDTPTANEPSVVTSDTESQNAAAEPAAQTTDENSADSQKASDSTGDTSKPKRPSKVGKEVAKLRREVRTVVSQNEQLSSDLQQAISTINELKQGERRNSLPEPEINDFESTEAFLKAHKSWEEATTATTSAQPAVPRKPPKQSQPKDPFTTEREALFDQGKKQFGDEFMEVMTSQTDVLPINPDTAGFMFDNPESGAALVMYLDENREEAEKLFHMSGLRLDKRLQKISEKLNSTSPANKSSDAENTDEIETENHAAAPSKKVSQAPKPQGDAVKTGTQTAAGDLNSMDMDSYAANRRRQEMESRVI